MGAGHQDGSQIDAVDDDGNSEAFRLVPFPNADYNDADTADHRDHPAASEAPGRQSAGRDRGQH